MKLVLISSLVGLVIGVGLTIIYFAMAKFFAANATALDTHQKATEQILGEIGQVDHSMAKDGIKAVAKAGN